MNEQANSQEITNADLRRMLTWIHATLAYGSTTATGVLAIGWLVVGIRDSTDVPPLLPILTIAAAVFSVIALANHSDIKVVQERTTW